MAVPNELIAVGDDPDAVLAEAAEKLGLPVNALVLTTIVDPATRVDISWY